MTQYHIGTVRQGGADASFLFLFCRPQEDLSAQNESVACLVRTSSLSQVFIFYNIFYRIYSGICTVTAKMSTIRKSETLL